MVSALRYFDGYMDGNVVSYVINWLLINFTVLAVHWVITYIDSKAFPLLNVLHIILPNNIVLELLT
jgi:hypothetical protein